MTKEKLLKKKIAIVTMGCDKNTVDSERMAFKLKDAGFEIIGDIEKAHIVIINTCAFLQSAREENINKILEIASLKEQNLEKLIVCGCLPQKHYDEVKQALPEVDLFLKLVENKHIAQKIFELYKCKDILNLVGKAPNRLLSTPSHYAYFKIADGCNNFCAFCTIPLFRGRYYSTPQTSLLEEAESLAKAGTKELILVAQDVTKYGKDLEGGENLVSLIQGLSKINGIEWVRLHYCYPSLITPELLKEIDTNPKVCKYLDIPFQHVSNNVLKGMNRRDTFESITKLLNQIKKLKNPIAIRSTFMCGFPGETRRDFKILKEFLKQQNLYNVGFFAFSREEGTRAYTYKKQVPQFIKNKRVKILQKIQADIMIENQQKFVGKTLNVLIDEITPENTYIGRTEYQSPGVDTVVHFVSQKPLNIGEFVNVKITAISDNLDLLGERIEIKTHKTKTAKKLTTKENKTTKKVCKTNKK